MKVANVIMALLFVFSVTVQYNDPDPIRWIAIYGGAALACILAQRGKLPRWLPVLVGAAAVIWIAIWMPRVLGQVGFSEMFRDAGMATIEIEEGREVIGLLLVAIWMLVLFLKKPARSALPTQPHV
ncbi:MAG: transmembrane 220 family protein [Longimicrobiales bacterium]